MVLNLSSDPIDKALHHFTPATMLVLVCTNLAMQLICVVLFICLVQRPCGEATAVMPEVIFCKSANSLCRM